MVETDTHRFEDGLCYGCRKRYRSRVGTFSEESRCRTCGAPLCVPCWQGRRDRCAEHLEGPAAPAGEGGRSGLPALPPPGALTRSAARDLEENFLQRVERNALEQASFFHPGEGRAYPQGDRSVDRLEPGAEEVRRLMRAGAAANPREVFAEMPLNRALRYAVSARTLLGKRAVPVAVAGACVSPLAELADPGWSCRRAEWRDASAAVDRLAADGAVFHYCAVFATAGWSEDAPRMLADRPHALIALVERRGAVWGVTRTSDPRWAQAPGLFRLHTEPECRELVAGFVRAHPFELLMGWLTDAWTAERLGLDRDDVRRGFETLCRTDPFVQGEISGDVFRLTRVY